MDEWERGWMNKRSSIHCGEGRIGWMNGDAGWEEREGAKGGGEEQGGSAGEKTQAAGGEEAKSHSVSYDTKTENTTAKVNLEKQQRNTPSTPLLPLTGI
eukprot:4331516-Pleurochrysis_carterae.AAC.1